MVSIVSALNICANLSIVAAGSRQAWAFARDEGLPFSSWFRRVSTIGIPIPINAILASLTITIAISLLNLGSTTAFLSVVGLLASAGAMSYAISISCVLWRRLRGKPLPKSPFSLGRYVSYTTIPLLAPRHFRLTMQGVPINIVAIAFALFQVVMSFFPLTAVVNHETMNYGVVMFSGVAIISVAYYIVRARHVYKGPVVHINYD